MSGEGLEQQEEETSRKLVLLDVDRAERAASLALRLAAAGELDLRRARRAAKKLRKAHPYLSCFDLAWLIAANSRLRDGRFGPLVADSDPKSRPGRPIDYGGPALRGRPPVARNSMSAVLMLARRRARYTRLLLAAVTGFDIVSLERSFAAPLQVLEPGAEILRRTLHLSDAELCNAELGTWLDEEQGEGLRVVKSQDLRLKKRNQLRLFDEEVS